MCGGGPHSGGAVGVELDDSPWMRKGPAMRCPSCAADVEATHRFCHQCAAPLGSSLPPDESSASSPINVVPLSLLGVTEPEIAPSLPSRSVAPDVTPPAATPPLAAPLLAPPPTFQPVPGGVPQPQPTAATIPLTSSTAAVPTVPTQPIPLAQTLSLGAAVPVVADPTPQFIGFDSKGEPVPPPPMTVGEPILSATVATEPVPVVEQTPADEWLAATAEQSAVTARSGSTAVLPTVDDHRFRLTTLLVLAVLTGVVAVSAGVLDVVSFLVTGTDSAASTLVMDDLSSNHLIGIGIGVFLLLVGAVIGATGRRSGAGLAGGASLALAGLMVNAVGLGVDALDEVEVRYLATPGNTITSTREIGFFLAIGAAGLAGLAFAASLGAARGGGRPRIALVLLGILATGAAAAGPLVPLHDAVWLDNWAQEGVPDATLWLRLATLALLLVAGITAFSIGGRFGGAMALGAVSIGVFQSITSYLEIGDLPLGLANGNFFAPDGGLEVEPHLVTLAGLMAVVLLAVVTIMVPTRRRAA
ncbi:MAG: hypothetical protein RJB61_176 [Actinomycetota bacterium]